jgi:ADP-heptose:LPS heptosyltransferase
MPDLDCRPCFKRECPRGTTECLTGITPARVEQELDELLRDAARTEPGR